MNNVARHEMEDAVAKILRDELNYSEYQAMYMVTEMPVETLQRYLDAVEPYIVDLQVSRETFKHQPWNY